MYKKRFAKWGFTKNRQTTSTEFTTRDVSSRPEDDTHEIGPDKLPFRLYHKYHNEKLAVGLSMGLTDTAMIAALVGIRDWSAAILISNEQRRTSSSQKNSIARPQNGDSTTMYRTFILASDLLSLGQGHLAGKAIRKLFIMLEETVDDVSPLLMWNLLDLLYEIAGQGQMQLFSLFLAHLVALSQKRLPDRHPVLQTSRHLLSIGRSCLSAECTHHLDAARQYNFRIMDEYIESREFLRYRQTFSDSCFFRLRLCQLPEFEPFIATVWVLDRSPSAGGGGYDALDSCIVSLFYQHNQPSNHRRVEARRLAQEFLRLSGNNEQPTGAEKITLGAKKMLAKIELRSEPWVPYSSAEVRNVASEKNCQRALKELIFLEKLLRLKGLNAEADQTNREALERARAYLDDIPEMS